MVKLETKEDRQTKRDIKRQRLNRRKVMFTGVERRGKNALWARTTKNLDVSTGPLARPFACSLAPLNRSLPLDYS